jgi:hypothetical protein
MWGARRSKGAVRSLALVAVISAWSAIGCGGPYDASVSGLVSLDGSTITRGTVTFASVDGGPTAYARIDSGGKFVVRTGREKGLPAGEYAVSVVANEAPAIKETAEGGPPPAGKPITPPWYRSQRTSGLRFMVETGSNEIDLELTSDPPPDWKPRRRR